MAREQRDAVWFFVGYSVVLVSGIGWTFLRHVDMHTNGNLTPIRTVLACAFGYLGLRAYLVLVRQVSGVWDRIWIAADLVLISLAVRFSGGIDSEVAVLYAWPIAMSSIQRQPRGTIVIGVASAMLYVGATTWCKLKQEEDPGQLGTYFYVILLTTALGAGHARGEARRVEAFARLRAQVALANYRSGLSREMHDGIQHYLVQIAVRLELAKLLLAENAEKAAKIAIDECVTVRQANEELRYLVRRLRSPVLEESGLVDGLRNHVSRFAQRSSIAAHFEIEGAPTGLKPDVEHATFRIVQEALTNAEKYSDADGVETRLVFGPDTFACVIVDDGVGFKMPDEDVHGSNEIEDDVGGGLGLRSMRERSNAAGGDLRISSAPGKGTEIVFTVSLDARDAHELPEEADAVRV